MKTWWSNNWKRLAETDSGFGLSFFRIHCAIAILLEVMQLWVERRLIFTDHPLGTWRHIDPSLPLLCWMAVLMAVGLGWRTRVMTLLNWLCAMAWSFNAGDFEYHNDYFMWGTSTLLLFMPSALPWSLDRQRLAGRPMPATRVVAYRALLIFFGVGLVYFDSLFWKYGDTMWMRGLGLWYPSTLPQVGWADLSPILGNEWLARGAGYLALAFESVFLFLLPVRAARWPLIVTGVALHVGIFVAFPIPAFGFSVIAVYWLLVPDECYQRWFKVQPAVGPTRPDARRWAVVAMAVGLALQMVFSIDGPPLVRQAAVALLNKKPARAFFKCTTPVLLAIRPYTARLFGIITHCVFTYHLQFEGYGHPLAIREAGTQRWLPLITPEGRVHPWCHGRVFVHFQWRVNSATPSQARIERGMGRLAELDCYERGVDPTTVRYEVLCHPFALAPEWMPPAQLPKVTPETWQRVFDLAWQDGHFVMTSRPEAKTLIPRLLP
jgi:hypothetical protein